MISTVPTTDKILQTISEIIDCGVFNQDIDALIDLCKQLNIYNHNQYFFNIVSDLEQKIVYEFNDLYILEDIDKLKLFVQNYKIINSQKII